MNKPTEFWRKQYGIYQHYKDVYEYYVAFF